MCPFLVEYLVERYAKQWEIIVISKRHTWQLLQAYRLAGAIVPSWQNVSTGHISYRGRNLCIDDRGSRASGGKVANENARP